MKKAEKIVIIGAGGHGKVVADAALASGIEDIVFFDQNPYLERTLLGFPVFSASDEGKGREPFIAVGRNSTRKDLWSSWIESFSPKIVHPQTTLARQIDLGPGTFVAAGVVVNIHCKIGKGVILNTSCSVDHDCHIGDFVHISPGANLAGGVSVGAGAWVGIGAVICENLSIGENATIGAGAVVIDSVPDGYTVVGNPARSINRR
ncbi:MAG: acetyltransferase [Roseibium sp.]